MKKIIVTIAATLGLLAASSSVALAGSPTTPDPTPPECVPYVQPYQNSLSNLSQDEAHWLLQAYNLEIQVDALRSKIAKKNATIARLRHRLHRG